MTTPWTFPGALPSLPHSSGVVTLVEGQSFCLSARNGDIRPGLPDGLFVLDTRVLSRWELLADGVPLESLTVAHPAPFEATFVCRGTPPPGQADAELVVLRHRSVSNGMYERLVLRNYGMEAKSVVVELRFDADLADLFEVKEGRASTRPASVPELRPPSIIFRAAESAKRAYVSCLSPDAHVRLDHDESNMRDKGGVLVWRCEIAAGAEREIDFEVGFGPEEAPRPGSSPYGRVPGPEQRLASWRASMPAVESDSPALDAAVARAREDLGALRIFDPDHAELPVIAAGAPWFMTVFGRDSLLASWMSLLADTDLALGVLDTLARFQGKDVVPSTEEEPGRILHEIRFGSASRLSLGGGQIYYGTIDATPLFVMLLGELRQWGLADDALARLLPHADSALDWIANFGDRDGDGYVEYQRATPAGLANQGWKDSWDGILSAEGKPAETPIALCEVQGYTYAAYRARARLALEAGDERTHARYIERARRLKEAFNRDFWLDDREWFALGLDADKRPIDGLASNMGHCLWTGIVDDDKASAVADRLVSPELFSGWGIRTLATSMRAYNPISYHNGSVWPHDSALCAAGLMRYGFVEEAHRVLEGLLDAAYTNGGRLPELFAGLSRDDVSVPAAYPTSCVPQAWAAAAPLLLLRALLRLDPEAPAGRLWLAPELPASVRHCRVEGIEVAGHRIVIDVNRGRCEVGATGSLQVMSAARPTDASIAVQDFPLPSAG